MGDSGGRKGQVMGDLGGETRRNQRSACTQRSVRIERSRKFWGLPEHVLAKPRADNPEEYTLGVDISMRHLRSRKHRIKDPIATYPPDIRRTREM